MQSFIERLVTAFIGHASNRGVLENSMYSKGTSKMYLKDSITQPVCFVLSNLSKVFLVLC